MKFRDGCWYFARAVNNGQESPNIVDEVKELAEAASKYVELLKQKDMAEASFTLEKIMGM